MSIFTKLFGKNQNLKECPRCLGKGQVGWDDIKRGIESNVPVDATYLVINLDEEERKRIVNGHPDAIEQGKQYENAIHAFIDQITYLHIEGGLTPFQIDKY